MSSTRSGRKRAADSDAELDASTVAASAVAAAAPPQPKRTRLPAGALREGDAPLGGEHPSIARRQFWQQFDTELLRAWLLDFRDWKSMLPKAKTASRDVLLDALVERDAVRPKGKSLAAQLDGLQKNFLKAHPDAAAPGLEPALRPVPASAPPASAPAQRDRSPQRQPLFSEAEDEEEGDNESDEEEPPPASTPPRHPPASAARDLQRDFSRAAAAAGPLPHHWEHGCLTCTTVPSAGLVSATGAWVCHRCGLRGDLDASHAANAHLGRASGQHAPPSSAADGQTTRDATDSAPADKLEKHLLALSARLGTPHPLFSTKATAPAPSDAIRTVRQALGASTTESPSLQLLSLIQSGKLLDASFAVPRPFLRDVGSVDALATISFGAGGPVLNTTKDPTRPPPLASLEEFTLALVSTILPALIDRPAAMVEWLALTRTVLHLSNKDGWPSARRYLDALLRERIGVADKLPFAPPSDPALRDIRADATRERFGFPPIAPGQRAPSNTRPPGGKCHSFQSSGACGRAGGGVCFFEHVCAVCGAADHGALQRTTCAAQYKPPAPGPQRPAGSGSKGKRGGGGSGRTAPSSGASVTTKPGTS